MEERFKHVVLRDEKWTIVEEGSAEIRYSTDIREEAIYRAKEFAKSEGTVLFVHLPTGKIEFCTTYSTEL